MDIKWYSCEECPPESGQLCTVKMLVTMQAYFVPECKMSTWVAVDDQSIKQEAVSWKPVEGARKMKGYNPPNSEQPYQDID